MGAPQEQAQHELRQTEPGTEILLRQGTADNTTVTAAKRVLRYLQVGRLTIFFPLFQNIIKKVSGQKFVYKFVSQPDPSLPDGIRSIEEGQRRDVSDSNNQSKSLGGVAPTCPTKGLPQVRPHFLCFQGVMNNWLIAFFLSLRLSAWITSARHPAAPRRAPETTT